MQEPFYDPVVLAEIALLAEVIVAATQADGPLPGDVLDAVLGAHPQVRTA